MKYYMLNKPAGCVTARTDALHPTVMQLFEPELRDSLHPVGRLDKNTEGLLIVTDDGKLTHRLMQPEYHVPKIYAFRAFGELSPDDISLLEGGVYFKGLDVTTKPAVVTVTGHCSVQDIEPFLPDDRHDEYMRNPDGGIVCGTLCITQGIRHQVKRMLQAVGCKVCTLQRIAVGPLILDDGLAVGKYRPLTSDEIKAIISAAFPDGRSDA